MTNLSELLREYERKRYPPARRLDIQRESPESAADRALHWIQSRAHETPGADLLLVVDRGISPGTEPRAVERHVRKLLDRLKGRLIDWWEPFTPGTLALRLAVEPVWEVPRQRKEPDPIGRTAETAGSARPDIEKDVPPELWDAVSRVAGLRVEREGHSIRLKPVISREVWIEAQAIAMDRRLSFGDALQELYQAELEMASEE